MRRRDLLAALGSAASWPLAARAQHAMPVVGFVNGASPVAGRADAFRKGLNEAGFIEGQNVRVEYHWLDGQFDRLPSLMADLVRRRVAVIATPGGNPARAAKAATTTIPIVFGVGEDPAKLGLIASLARPGGNATGFNFFHHEIMGKRLGLLHELVPKAVRIAVLVNPANAPNAESTLRATSEAAGAIGLQFRCSRPEPAARSRRPSQPLSASGPTRSSSPPTRSWGAGASKLRRSRLVTRFLRLILIECSSKSAGL